VCKFLLGFGSDQVPEFGRPARIAKRPRVYAVFLVYRSMSHRSGGCSRKQPSLRLGGVGACQKPAAEVNVMSTINHHLVEIALERSDGASFEKFAQAFFAELSGVDFIPLGGLHDGGAEAFTEPGVFETKRAGHFWQASIQKTIRAKIRGTVKRLVEYGRKLTQLTYCTSIVVPNVDGEEDLLSEELGLRVKIRDQKYIVSHINHSPQTVQAFNSYLAPHLDFLKAIGGTTIVSYSPDLPARSLCVFLGQEVERRRGNTQLLEGVTDALILWALDGTDPEKGTFLSRGEILDRITNALPAAKQFIKGVLDS
jgi:hypothetical protein